MGTGGADQGSRWTGTTMASAPMVVFLALILVGSALIVSTDGGWVAGVGFTAVLLVFLMTFMYVRIEIDRHGLECRFGPWGWPKISRRIQDVESVTTRRVEWWRYGLGLRWIPRGWAVVPRSGDAVEVVLRGGRRLVFTTPEAESAARRLNELLQAERGQ